MSFQSSFENLSFTYLVSLVVFLSFINSHESLSELFYFLKDFFSSGPENDNHNALKTTQTSSLRNPERTHKPSQK